MSAYLHATVEKAFLGAMLATRHVTARLELTRALFEGMAIQEAWEKAARAMAIYRDGPGRERREVVILHVLEIRSLALEAVMKVPAGPDRIALGHAADALKTLLEALA